MKRITVSLLIFVFCFGAAAAAAADEELVSEVPWIEGALGHYRLVPVVILTGAGPVTPQAPVVIAGPSNVTLSVCALLIVILQTAAVILLVRLGSQVHRVEFEGAAITSEFAETGPGGTPADQGAQDVSARRVDGGGPEPAETGGWK
jgi:hypothetical protein